MGNHEEVIGIVVGCIVLISLVAIIGGFLQIRGKRVMAHAERMKALELGREMPAVSVENQSNEKNEGRSFVGQCYSVAGHASFWGFIFAVGASAKEGGGSSAVAIAIAAAAGAIGVTSVICGTVLAARVPAPGSQPEYASAKVHYDPDGI